MDPAVALGAGYDTLCAQDHTVFLLVLKGVKDAFDLLLGVLLGSFLAPACEYLVSVMMVVIVAAAGAILTVFVMVLVMMLVLVFVIVATAGAILAVLMMVFVMMLMLMIVIMTTAGALLAVIVVMLVMMLVLVFVIVATAGTILTVLMVMVMMMVAVLHKLGKLALKGVFVFHGGNYVSTAEKLPIGGNDGCVIVEIFYDIQSAVKLFLGNVGGMRENYGVCKLDLIVEKLAEILRVLFALICVNNGGKAVKYHILGGNVLHRLDNVGKLANARGLDEDTLGSVGLNHLGESLAEIAHKGAADAARVHFGDLNACVLHKSAVDTYGAEFIFNKNELFARKSLFDKLFDKRGLTCAQKS